MPEALCSFIRLTASDIALQVVLPSAVRKANKIPLKSKILITLLNIKNITLYEVQNNTKKKKTIKSNKSID